MLLHAQLPALKRQLKSPTTFAACLIMLFMVIIAILAPWLNTIDPTQINPATRLSPPSAEHWFGSDPFGRDVYSRVIYGARVSLIVGLGAALISLFFGLIIGVLAGYFRVLDAIIMRIMDGVMAIPNILLAIALVSLAGGSLTTVLVAIVIPEVPRVVRLVRSVILSIRTEPYVEAAVTLGTRVPTIIFKHIIPNTWAPLIVQCTYIFAAAILIEATLSFLGAGLPPEIPSWGNIMAEGRKYFQIYPSMVFFPGLFLALTLLSVNILGDVLRDELDPRMVKRN